MAKNKRRKRRSGITFEEIRKNVTAWYSYFQHNIEFGNYCERFEHGEQFAPDEMAALEMLQLPIVVDNNVADVALKIKGKFRDVRPEIYVHSATPVNKENTEQLQQMQSVVNVYEGHLRYLQNRSNAREAYYKAFDNLFSKGYAALHVVDDYDPDNKFQRTTYIESLPLPEYAFFSPYAKCSDRSDGDYCGVFTVMDKERFHKEYPNVTTPQSFAPPMMSIYDFNISWGNDETITVCDYYYKKYYTKTIYLLDTDDVVSKEEYQELMRIVPRAMLPTIVDERKDTDCEIRHVRCIQDQILEENVIAGKKLRVIFMAANTYYDEGRFYTEPYIKNAISPQQQLNYLSVQINAMLKKMRRERFLVTKKHVTGYEHIWRTPEMIEGALEYNPGSGMPGDPEKPDIIAPYQIPPSLIQLYEQIQNKISRILGAFDTRSNDMPNNASGVAVEARLMEGNANIKIYRDAVLQGIRSTGKCIVSMMQALMLREQTIPIKQMSGSIDYERINVLDRPSGRFQNDISAYNVELDVEAGPGYEIEQERQFNQLIQLAQVSPQIVPSIIDIIASKIRISESSEMRARLLELLPPAAKAIAEGEDPQQLQQQPDPQQQMMQLEMQLKQAEMQVKQEEVAVKKAHVENERMKISYDAMAREQEAAADEQQVMADLAETNARARAELTKAALEHDAEMANQRTSIMQTIMSQSRQSSGGERPPD